MRSFYWVRPAADDDPRFGPALHQDLDIAEQVRLIRAIKSNRTISDWRELVFATTTNAWADLPLAFLGTLCSDRLRSTIDSHRGPLDLLEWLPCWALTKGDQRLRYWILHFLDRPDVLDRDASVLDSEGNPMNPVLKGNKLVNRVVIAHPDAYGSTFFVSGELARAILEGDFKGVAVDPQLVTNTPRED